MTEKQKLRRRSAQRIRGHGGRIRALMKEIDGISKLLDYTTPNLDVRKEKEARLRELINSARSSIERAGNELDWYREHIR